MKVAFKLSDYDVEIKNGEIILTKKNLTMEKLLSIDLSGSSLLDCSVFTTSNMISADEKNYRNILNDIWYSMEIQDVLRRTSFSMKNKNNNSESGYIYDNKLNLFIKGEDVNYTVREMLNMIKLNKYFINMKIKLKDNTEISYTNIVQ